MTTSAQEVHGALGPRLSRNGASFDSPGQSPGKPAPSAPALKGRHSFAAQRPGFCAALTGLGTRARSNPGLRLGLSNDGLSGLGTVARRAGGTNGGNPVGIGRARRSARAGRCPVVANGIVEPRMKHGLNTEGAKQFLYPCFIRVQSVAKNLALDARRATRPTLTSQLL